MRDLLMVLVVAAVVVATARLLPRLAAPGRTPLTGRHIVSILAVLFLAGLTAHVAGESVGTLIAEHFVAELHASGAQAIVTSPDAYRRLAHEGTVAAFALLAAPIAVAAIAVGLTSSRAAVFRVIGAALVGEVALTAASVALMRALAASLVNSADQGIQPMIDVVDVVGMVADNVAVFAVAGAIGGAAFAVIAMGPPLRARTPAERRALLVALCAAGPAALVLGALATPSPDVFTEILEALLIGVA